MSGVKRWCFILAMFFVSPAIAGTACTDKAATPQAMATAAGSAQRVLQALEKKNAPVALLARHGTDLKKYGLHYSHVGFVVRDHVDGKWTVIHLLNQCGTKRSDIYAQGLVNFFIDDLQSQDARIVWLTPEISERLAATLNSSNVNAMFDPDYNVIAHHQSTQYQNSTAWVLETIAAAQLQNTGTVKRSNAQALNQAHGFIPDTIQIDYTQRILGGLFSANTVFTDHSVGARLSGQYKVVTVRAIFRYLENLKHIEQQWEWRNNKLSGLPGPA
jgi:hypothetical protein